MNIQERKNKDGKITSYRIRVFDHRDAQTGKQVFRTLSVKYDDTKSAAWNKKNSEKQAVIFEKGIEEQTTSDSRVTFNEYCDYAIKIKEQSSISASIAYSYRRSQKRIAQYLGHIQLKKLTPTSIQAHGDQLAAAKRYQHTRGGKESRTQQTGCNSQDLQPYPQRQRPPLLRGRHPGDTENAQAQNGLTACKKIC
ncbi:MAG: hypothetical protein IKN17_11945 [Ruminococcus sp.]|nr:hypothetical protein [Ruminococcus sp.]